MDTTGMSEWIEISYTEMIEFIVDGASILLTTKGDKLYYKPHPDNRWIENQYKEMREENEKNMGMP